MRFARVIVLSSALAIVTLIAVYLDVATSGSYGVTTERAHAEEDSDGDGVFDIDDFCPGTAMGEFVDAVGCSDAQVDADGDGVCDPPAPSAGPSGCTGVDNCPNQANLDQADADADLLGDACDTGDSDGDFLSDETEYWCGSASGDATSVPERLGNGVDDDGDAVVEETQTAVPGFDCDGDGYRDDIETAVGTSHQMRCADSISPNNEADDQWPADFNDNEALNLQDVNSFASPVKHFGQQAAGHERWNLAGGPSINLADVNSLGTLRPPMFNDERAFGNMMWGTAGHCPPDGQFPPR